MRILEFCNNNLGDGGGASFDNPFAERELLFVKCNIATMVQVMQMDM